METTSEKKFKEIFNLILRKVGRTSYHSGQVSIPRESAFDLGLREKCKSTGIVRESNQRPAALKAYALPIRHSDTPPRIHRNPLVLKAFSGFYN